MNAHCKEIHRLTTNNEKEKTVVFLMGTSYCGSTILGCVLNALPDSTYMGEVDRIKIFNRYPHYPQHMKSECAICSTHDEYDCPRWNNDMMKSISAKPNIIEQYLHMIDSMNAKIVIDGSKNPAWFHELLLKGLHKSVFVISIISVRQVWHTVASLKKADVNPQVPWRAAEIWRDVYTHAIRLCTTFNIPFIVIRNEDFRTNPAFVIRQLARFFRIECSVNDVLESFTSVDLHCIGGNYGVYVHHVGFDIKTAIKRFPWAKERIKRNLGLPPIAPLSFTEANCLSLDELASVVNVPGLMDLLGHLGYAPLYDIAGVLNFHKKN